MIDDAPLRKIVRREGSDGSLRILECGHRQRVITWKPPAAGTPEETEVRCTACLYNHP